MYPTDLSPAGNASPTLPIAAESRPAFTSTPGRAHSSKRGAGALAKCDATPGKPTMRGLARAPTSKISGEARHSWCRDGTTAPPMALPKTVGRVEPEKPATHAAADRPLRLGVRIGAGLAVGAPFDLRPPAHLCGLEA